MPTLPRAGRTGYIGPMGRLVRLPTVAALSTPEERPSSEVRTMSGARLLVVAPSTRRTWSVQVPGARPHEVGALAELLRDGAGPYWWVDPYAQVTNVMTPDQTAGRVLPQYGTLRTGFDTFDGSPVSQVSFAAASGATFVRFGPVPIVPGIPVTLAAWVQTTASTDRLTLQWVDSVGAVVGTISGPQASASGSPQRLALTAVPPVGAAGVTMAVTTSAAITRPTITWTDGVREWAPGNGCSQAAVVGWDADVRATYAIPGAPRTKALSFDVQEVG